MPISHISSSSHILLIKVDPGLPKIKLFIICKVNVLKNKKGEKIHKADNSIKSFIQNKMTNYLTNSDLTEKLLLYNLISKNNNVNTEEGCKINNDDFIKSFSKNGNQIRIGMANINKPIVESALDKYGEGFTWTSGIFLGTDNIRVK